MQIFNKIYDAATIGSCKLFEKLIKRFDESVTWSYEEESIEDSQFYYVWNEGIPNFYPSFFSFSATSVSLLEHSTVETLIQQPIILSTVYIVEFPKQRIVNNPGLISYLTEEQRLIIYGALGGLDGVLNKFPSTCGKAYLRK